MPILLIDIKRLRATSILVVLEEGAGVVLDQPAGNRHP
jgi:hypothetical protein